MANLDLYIDIAALRAVQNFASSDSMPTLQFITWDTINTRIRLLERTASFPVNPYAFIPTTGLTLELAIGIDSGDPLSTQYTWTPSVTPSDPYFEASIPLNTAGIVTATSTGPVDAKLHIRKVGVDGTKTVLLAAVRLVPGIITDTSLVVPAPLTPASMEAVRALLANIITDSVTIRSADRTHSERLWLDNDATPHNDIS